MKTILYVEDDEISRMILRINLTKCGYSVIEAKNGEQGLKLFLEDNDSIDVVISDIRMPEMSGPDMIHLMREMKPTIKTILTSAGDEFEHCGLCPYVYKPINIPKLIKLIEG